MTLTDIARLRLNKQLLVGAKSNTVKHVVDWLGAIQAQDYAMAKWAIGIRMKQAADHILEESINKGEIIRTHVMRPTWHFTPAEDIRWLLALTKPHLKSSLKSYQVKLELNENIFKRSNAIIEKLLAGNNYLTRQEILSELKKKKITVDNMQAIHIMFDAELNGIVCNGPMRGKQFTYALIDERIAPTKPLSREESLGRIAEKYFTSHGPATVQDFAWWSGLPAADAKAGLELIKRNLSSVKVNEKVYWFSGELVADKVVEQNRPLFLPGYDEFMISYADRGASLDPKFSKMTLVGNGIFRPIIVVDGRIIGIWLRTVEKKCVVIQTKFFAGQKKLKKNQIENFLEPFGRFLNLPIHVK